jgi:hypothetical protein
VTIRHEPRDDLSRAQVTIRHEETDGAPMKHVRLNWDNLTVAIDKLLNIVDIPQRVKSILPKGENENLPKGQIQIDERVKSLTVDILNKKHFNKNLTIDGHTYAHTHPYPGTISEYAKNVHVCACVSLNDLEKRAWEWSQSHDFWKGRITNVEQLRINLVEKKPWMMRVNILIA